jgi:hypothetical protein
MAQGSHSPKAASDPKETFAEAIRLWIAAALDRAGLALDSAPQK